MRHGQFSIETLFIIGISAAFLIPMFVIFYDFLASSSDNIIQNQVQQLAQSFIDNANLIYNYGRGAMIVVDFTFPDRIVNMSIENNDTLVFRSQGRNGMVDNVYAFGINATGQFTQADWGKGKHSFEFRYIEGGDYVSIKRTYH